MNVKIDEVSKMLLTGDDGYSGNATSYPFNDSLECFDAGDLGEADSDNSSEAAGLNNNRTSICGGNVRISWEALAFNTFLNLATVGVGLVCNACVIFTVAKTKTLRGSSINRAVLNLCVADLVTIGIDLPLTTTILVGNYYNVMPWSIGLCHVQSFIHTLANSVQVLVFPVIGLERLFSIIHPFDKVRQLQRVNWFNGISWGLALTIAVISTTIFPKTSLSIYCTKTLLQANEVGLIFPKIYYITLPLGVAAVTCTVVCYGCIVYHVWKKQKTSLASTASRKYRSRSPSIMSAMLRPRSYSTPAVTIEPQDGKTIAAAAAMGAKQTSQLQIRIDEAPDHQLQTNGNHLLPLPQSSAKPVVLAPIDVGGFDVIPHEGCNGNGEAIAMQTFENAGKKSSTTLLSIPDEPRLMRPRSASEASSATSICSTCSWTSEDNSDGTRGDSGNLFLQVPQPRLQRSASEGNAPKIVLSRTSSVTSASSICSRIEFHDETGNVSIFNRRRLPSLLQGSVPRGAICIRDERAREQGKRRNEAATAQRSSYIVMLFLLMWSPLPILVGLSNHYIDEATKPEDIQKFLDLHVCALCFGAFSAAANPIIYGLAIKSFRTAIHRLLSRYRRKLSSDTKGGV